MFCEIQINFQELGTDMRLMVPVHHKQFNMLVKQNFFRVRKLSCKFALQQFFFMFIEPTLF